MELTSGLILLIVLSLVGIVGYKMFTKAKVEESQANYNKEASVLDFKRKELVVQTDELKEKLKQAPAELNPKDVEVFWQNRKDDK